MTLLEGDPKAPFSKATTPRYRRGHYCFPWITPITIDLYCIMLTVKQQGIKYHFQSLWYDSTRDLTLVSRTTGEHCNHYANKPVMYIHIYIYIYIYIYLYIYIYIQGSLNKFPDFFHIGTFIDSTRMKL